VFWGDEHKKSDDEKPETYMQKFFRACLLALAGVVALWLAVQLLAQFWGWLLLAAALGGLIWVAVWFIRWQRDRRW
jgi:FtsH-binding integral membrane protein